MQVENLRGICDDLLYYNVLQKRKVVFDALGEGLEVFRLWTAIRAFPTLFEPLFVASGTVTPEDVVRVIRFERPLDGDQERVAGYLLNIVRKKFSEQGEHVSTCVILYHSSFSPFLRTQRLLAMCHRKPLPPRECCQCLLHSCARLFWIKVCHMWQSADHIHPGGESRSSGIGLENCH